MPNVQPITVAFATNGAYVPLALCCLTSILLNASRRDNLHFVLLSDGLTEKEIALFQKALKIFHCDPNQLTVFPLKERLEAMDLPSFRGNKATWLRLLLPELLPKVSHVIYTDVDTLWCCDVQTFAPWMTMETSVAWCPDVHAHESWAGHTRQNRKTTEEHHRHLAWFQKHGISFDPRVYQNAGVLVLNLEKLRKEHFSERWLAFLKNHPNPPYPDQDTLYCLLKDDVTLLPEWCNWITQLPEQAPFPAVLHYAGRPHPWCANGKMRVPKADDLLLFVDFWKTVMEPLYGEALAPYRWTYRFWPFWDSRIWHPLQRRFPVLYHLAHYRLIQRAKLSEAKAEKLQVLWWDIHQRSLCMCSRISQATRRNLRKQWGQELQPLIEKRKER